MSPREKLIDRRRYERRGVVVHDSEAGRPIADTLRRRLTEQFVKRYGDGWELESIQRGSVVYDPHLQEWTDSHILLFKRRRQLRDE